MTVTSPRHCHLCGQKLQGSYIQYDTGLIVCEQCNATAPRCSQCNIPSQRLQQVRGIMVCPACMQRASRCASCQLPIFGKYFLIGDSPLHYCESCVQTQPACDICRVPLNEQGKVLKGQTGQEYRCANCMQTAVTSDAQRLYEQTHRLLTRTLGLDIPTLPALHIVERAELARLHHEVSLLENPATPVGPEHQHLLGFFKRIDDSRDIYIERLLPQILFQAVAAHELAHAWQSFHAPDQQPLKIIEGFAEWVAYKTLVSQGQQREAARLTRRNDLYGEGLQYFIALEKRSGLQGVLQRARQV